MKYVVGIDISKDNFHVCIKERVENANAKIKASRSFSNDYRGFNELSAWVSKIIKAEPCKFVMEATGCYYEELAYFLFENSKAVFVVLPNKIKHFAQSINIKTKTDKVDAALISEFGIERNIPAWKPMSVQYKHLRDLCRELLSLKKERSRAKCQLHAIRYSHDKNTIVVGIKEEQIQFYENAILEIESEIKLCVSTDKELKERADKIITVKGLQLITVIIILCETNGFQMFNNIRQVVSYAGLDVVMKESGNFKGKTRISKKGNARIRQCLFMPALTASVHNDKIKALYERVNEKNPEIKRKGVVAGMRKLLILIFVLWKKNQEYKPHYQWAC